VYQFLDMNLYVANDHQTIRLLPTSLTRASVLARLLLTLRRPLLPCGYSYKASCARPG